MTRDEKLRADIGMHENLMEDFAALADILIGNETPDDFTDDGDYQPLLMLISEFHFSPENDRIYSEVKNRINLLKEKVLKLSTQVDANHKKGKFIYRKR